MVKEGGCAVVKEGGCGHLFTDLLLVAVESQRCDAEHVLVDTFRQLLAPRLAAHKDLIHAPLPKFASKIVGPYDKWDPALTSNLPVALKCVRLSRNHVHLSASVCHTRPQPVTTRPDQPPSNRRLRWIVRTLSTVTCCLMDSLLCPTLPTVTLQT